jgi:phospholipid/cholesterol/gamma-HCH transport system ATP-binding protein
MIQFENVRLSFGRRQVFSDLSFSVDFREKMAILGGSGEGKTTILKLIMGLIKPDSGRILVEGEDITAKSESELRDVRMKFSLIFQEGALFDSLNVKENVAFCLREYTKMSEEEIDEKVREMLRTVGVESALELMPEELSGGMHRRVSIARALAFCSPKMFLYDEPTTGLDPVNSYNICKLISGMGAGGAGLIIVTHKVSDALKVAKRFLFLYEGAILFDGDAEGLMHSGVPELHSFIAAEAL